jgi:LAS superfamily LD-carboxypeptidase LdcB
MARRHPLRVDHCWSTQLLQALKSGRWRIACASTALTGRSFPQLRLALDRLNADQRLALARAMDQRTGLATVRSDERAAAELQPAIIDATARDLPRHDHAVLLQAAGRDRFGRRHWLQPAACRAWTRMLQAAHRDGVELELISSFRSFRDQCRILQRKRRQGLDWSLILRVSAAPGFSEHHTGCAVDIAVPGQPPLTEDFEQSPAFAWLSTHAGSHGFHLSYPRDNCWGYIYEPWHWRYWPATSDRASP